MFRTVPLSITVHTAMVYVIQVMMTACEQDQDGTSSVLILLASCQHNLVCKHRIILYRQDAFHLLEYFNILTLYTGCFTTLGHNCRR